MINATMVTVLFAGLSVWWNSFELAILTSSINRCWENSDVLFSPYICLERVWVANINFKLYRRSPNNPRKISSEIAVIHELPEILKLFSSRGGNRGRTLLYCSLLSDLMALDGQRLENLP
jgi:hypothetical protein